MNQTSSRLPLLAVAALSLCLGLTGIRWGLPSEYRNSLYFSSAAAMNDSLKDFDSSQVASSMTSQKKERPTEFYDPIRSYHADESIYLKAVSNLDPRKGQFNPHLFWWGALYIYLLAGVWAVSGLVGLIPLSMNLTLFFNHPELIARFYLLGRLLSAGFITGAGYLTYRLSLKMENDRRPALLVFLICALLPLFSIYSKIMCTDPCALFFLMLTSLYAWRLFADLAAWQNPRALMKCGALLGLTASAKYNFGVLAVLHLAVLLFCQLAEVRGRVRWPDLIRSVAAGAGVCGAVFFLVNPFCVLAPEEFWGHFGKLANLYAAGGVATTNLQYLPGFVNGVLYYLETLWFGFGWFNCILLVGAFLLFLHHRDRRDFFLLAMFLVTFLFLARSYKKHEHYLLPAYPFLAAFLARQLAWAWSRPGVLAAAGRAAIVLLLVLSFGYTLAIDLQLRGRNNRELVSETINGHYPAGTVIGVFDPYAYWAPPLWRDQYRIVSLKIDTAVVDSVQVFVVSDLEYSLYAGHPAVRGVKARAIAPYRVINDPPRIFGVFPIDWPQYDLAQNLFPRYFISEEIAIQAPG